MSYISTIQRRQRGHTLWRFVLSLSLVSACFLASVFDAGAAGIKDIRPTVSDLRAGSHPEMLMEMDFDYKNGSALGGPDNDSIQHMLIKMPKGLLGNLNSVPKCPVDVFNDNDTGRDLNKCDYTMHDTMIGQLYGHMRLDSPVLVGVQNIDINDDNGRIFNLEHAKGELARFGIHIYPWDGAPTEVRLQLPVYTDPNDSQRVVVDMVGMPREILGLDYVVKDLQMLLGNRGTGSVKVDQQGDDPDDPLAILTMPTFCNEPGKIEVQTVDFDGGHTAKTADLPPATDCAHLKFDPDVSFTRENDVKTVETPVKATVKVSHPRDPDPAVRSKSAVASTTVTLPKGMELSPAVGEGLISCTQAQFDVTDQTHPAACPTNAQIGSASITTAEIDKPLAGNIYLGEVAKPNPDPQAPWGVEAKVYLEVAHPDAAGILWHGAQVHIPGTDWQEPFRYKAVGTLQVAKNDVNIPGLGAIKAGQVITKFGVQPEPSLLPVKWDELSLTLFSPSNNRAALANPISCSQAFQGSASFTPWSDAPTFTKQVDRSFSVDTVNFDGNRTCPSPRPYKPTFAAKVLGDQSAGQSPDGLQITIGRSVQDDWLSSMKILLPRGMTGKLGSLLPACKWVDVDKKACPPSSKLGTLNATIGFGDDTMTLPGEIRFMEPDASGNNVAMTMDAKVGPFDLGVVVIRGTFGLTGIGANQRIQFVVNDMPTRVNGVATPIQKVVTTMNPSPGFFASPFDCSVDRSFEFSTTSAFDKTTVGPILSSWKPVGGIGC